MKRKLIQLTYEIQLNPGETLQLPPAISRELEGGMWRITLEKISNLSLPDPKNYHQRREFDSFSND